MVNVDWNSVPEAGDNTSLEAGGYVARIVDAVDVPEKEYVLVSFDIAEGPYKGYFQALKDRLNLEFWPSGGKYYFSYKQKALPFAKMFVKALQSSNPGFVYANDESTLTGKLFGVIFGEEEYDYGGEVRTRLRYRKVMDADRIRKGDFTVPKCKLLAAQSPAAGYTGPAAAPAFQTAAYSSGSAADFCPIDEDSGDLPF